MLRRASITSVLGTTAGRRGGLPARTSRSPISMLRIRRPGICTPTAGTILFFTSSTPGAREKHTHWTADQAQELWTTGKVRGIQGHHGNSVAANSGMAGDPDYIKFVEQGEEHLAELGGNYRNPTTGPKIARGVGALSALQVLVSAFADYQQVKTTGVTESMSPFSFGQTYIVDPAQAAKTLDDAYIQVSGDNAGTYHVQNGQYIRTECSDKPEKCAIDPAKLQGAQFEIVKPM